MQIGQDTVVTLKYRVTDPDGNVVDEGKMPLTYLHGGYHGIFLRIEEELEGKSAGTAIEVKLQPEDAFGEYDADLVTVEPRDLFPDTIEVGMQFERATEGESDEMLYTITDIAGDKVVVDGNHPLAGAALVFACTVTEVRAASAEELAHGHVHGPEGHHHH
ncbi:FKBP-type peptidyl-prolyl cis-trans isomerase [Sulfurisoma sediminicola]|uniref:peptidylprolyl isomerase n=1 Tax=Sulfurisoma sediminicola TaxID=1381557 RepID=A0A497XCY4_9PROT|nr:peptidylprolyl isomerase [Sulfurisoma sediminicola]RLJ64549.1 FKBP-type peptidyl-prolyl cis-trans isomerase SlyD [Sulfurisoma sediminicola]